MIAQSTPSFLIALIISLAALAMIIGMITHFGSVLGSANSSISNLANAVRNTIWQEIPQGYGSIVVGWQ